jgi:hypothetical protein
MWHITGISLRHGAVCALNEKIMRILCTLKFIQYEF